MGLTRSSRVGRSRPRQELTWVSSTRAACRRPLTKLFNMSRSYSLWVYQWGLAVLRDRDGRSVRLAVCTT